MANTIIRPKNREEWLELRKSGIGSSEIGTLMGVNPYETPYQLWRRKMGIDTSNEETFAMRAGHYLEDAVAQFWQDETGKRVIKSSAGDWLIRDNDKPFLQVSPDRTFWVSEGSHEKGILECKTTQKKIDEDDIPPYWFCQLQYQLGVANYSHGSLAWLMAGRQFGYKDIDLVPDFYEREKEVIEKFWVDNIIGGVEPDVISVSDVIVKYQQSTQGKTIAANSEILDAVMRLREARKEMAALEERQKSYEDAIKLYLADAEVLENDGEILATWKSSKPTKRFNAKRFCESNPQLASEFMDEVNGSRRFVMK